MPCLETLISSLSSFIAIFFWSVTCVLYIITYFEHGNVSFEGFQYYHLQREKAKIQQHLQILAITPDLEIVFFWSFNYICQFSKLYILVWTFPKFRTTFIFECYSKQ